MTSPRPKGRRFLLHRELPLYIHMHTGLTTSEMRSRFLPNFTYIAPTLTGLPPMGLPSGSPHASIHLEMRRCSLADPMLFIMFALYEMIAMFPCSYGRLGSMRSTDGILSRVRSNVIGMPRIGHSFGTNTVMNSSRVIRKQSFRVRSCRHRRGRGLAFLDLMAVAIIVSMLSARYFFMYSLRSFRPRTPAFLRWSTFASFWHLRQICVFLFPHIGKSLSSRSCRHFLQIRMVLRRLVFSKSIIPRNPMERRFLPGLKAEVSAPNIR